MMTSFLVTFIFDTEGVFTQNIQRVVAWKSKSKYPAHGTSHLWLRVWWTPDTDTFYPDRDWTNQKPGMGYIDQWEVIIWDSVKRELFTPKYLIHLNSERHKISSSSSYCDPIRGLGWLNWPIRGQEREHQRGSGNQFYHQGSANTIS